MPAALALGPDLVSIVGGGNDLLRPDGNPDRLAVRLEAAVVRLRQAGADVLMATGFDTADSPVVRLIRPKVALYNTMIWSIARRHGAHVLDLWGMRSLDDWRMWAEDRIHLTTAGHERVVQAALVALGLEPDVPDWDDPLTPLPPTPCVDRARSNAHWLRVHAAPDEKKLEQLRALEAGMRIDVAIVDTVPLGVDTPADLERARRFLAS